MKIYAETERLILREILPIDRNGMFEMYSDAEVLKYVGGNPSQTIEEVDAHIQFIRQQYTDNGVARWAAIEKTSGDFVGWSGLKLMKENINKHIDFYDIGYRFTRKYWGKGYATESCIAVRDYAFRTMNLEEIFAMTDVDNTASRKVLEKTGLKYIETFSYDGAPTWRESGQPATWYTMKNPGI